MGEIEYIFMRIWY